VQNRGDEVEVDDAEGLRMIEAGQAEAVDFVQGEAAPVVAGEGEAAPVVTGEGEAAPVVTGEGEAAPAVVDVEEVKNATEAETATKKVSTEKAAKK